MKNSFTDGLHFLLAYRDPRTKRLAEKQKQQLNSQLGAVPEKLSFKEKMKMFAMETGEDGTPRDKVKISRAQREIDNIGSPLGANNNNNNNRSWEERTSVHAVELESYVTIF